MYKLEVFIEEKSIHLSNGAKIVMFGVLVCIVSLFMDWIQSQWEIQEIGKAVSGNSFSRISGKPGFIIFFTLMMMIFSLFSIQRKEKMKLISHFYFQDYWVPIIGWFFLLLFSYHGMSIIDGYSIFVSGIIAGKWALFSMSGALTIIIGWFMMKHEFSSGKRGSFMSDLDDSPSSEKKQDKANMKLPF